MRWLVLTCFVGAVAHAEDLTAKEISQRSRDRGALNLVGLTATLKLVTTDKDGKSKEQVLTTSSKKIDNKSHVVTRFSQPPGVAGVAFLTVEGTAGEADDISLYLPKLKRVRKVAKQERGRAFMDTDFSYSDIASNGGRDEDFGKQPDDKVDGRDCWVIKGKGGSDTPYGEITVWVDKQTYVPMRVEYMDKDGKPLKRYHTLKLKAFKERAIAAESVMESVQSQSKTQMTVMSLDDAAVGDDAFTERALERGQ
jgi:outer membrane lipoprotein-sorting protein